MTTIDPHFRSRSLAKPGERLSVRMATAADGPLIGSMVQTDWRIEGVDWSACGANWLVAEIDGEVKGCIELLPGQPLGRLEFLGLMPGLSSRLSGRIVRALLHQGVGTLKLAGSQAVSSIVPHSMSSYGRALTRRGCVSIGDGDIVMRRL
jgi:hypothetical protein